MLCMILLLQPWRSRWLEGRHERPCFSGRETDEQFRGQADKSWLKCRNQMVLLRRKRRKPWRQLSGILPGGLLSTTKCYNRRSFSGWHKISWWIIGNVILKKKNWELWDSCPRGTGNQNNLLLCGTKWGLVGLGFSGAITASSLGCTGGVIRAMQHSWNLAEAHRSAFLSKQVVTTLSVRHLQSWQTYIVYSILLAWAGVTLKGSVSLRRCFSLGGCLAHSQIVPYLLAVDSV